MLDPRITPARPDLAAAYLEGQVEATRFVESQWRQIVAPIVDLKRRPQADAPIETQALYGEWVAVYEERDGWSWLQLNYKDYVGYIETSALGPARDPTHRVAALRTHAYPGPNIKLTPLTAIPLGAKLAVVDRIGEFLADGEGRYYWARHFAAVETAEHDFVAVAELFLNAPYLWGGRTSLGIDCSGLVQTALTAAGIAAPRDSDMLERLGAALPAEAPLLRGDLAFWKGHVGVMRDAETLLHANGYHMAVVSEPLATAQARIAASGGGGITSIRRLSA